MKNKELKGFKFRGRIQNEDKDECLVEVTSTDEQFLKYFRRIIEIEFRRYQGYLIRREQQRNLNLENIISGFEHPSDFMVKFMNMEYGQMETILAKVLDENPDVPITDFMLAYDKKRNPVAIYKREKVYDFRTDVVEEF